MSDDLEKVADIIFNHEGALGDFTMEFKNKRGLIKWLESML